MNDPRTTEEREEDARAWAAEWSELAGRTAQQVIWDDEREASFDYEDYERTIRSAARDYYGY